MFVHQQQPRSLLLLRSTTTTKNLQTRPSQIPNGTQTQSPLSQPVSLTHPESSDAGAWQEGREGTTSLSSRSTQAECGRAGLRAVQTKLSVSNAFVFTDVPGIPQLLCPRLLFFPTVGLQTRLSPSASELLVTVGRGNRRCVFLFFLPARNRLIRSKRRLMSSVRPVCGEIQLFSAHSDFCGIHFNTLNRLAAQREAVQMCSW